MQWRLIPLVCLALTVASACGDSNPTSSVPLSKPPTVIGPNPTVSPPGPIPAVTPDTAAPAPPTTAPASWPDQVAYHGMVYDEASDLVLVVGGLGDNISPVRKLWGFHPTEGRWDRLADVPAGLDPVGAPVAYDTESSRMIYLQTTAFDNETDPGSTWAYDSGPDSWSQVTTDTHPRLGFGARMAYDRESDRIIAFGGRIFTDGSQTSLEETPGTWAYDDNSATWERMNPATEPPGVNYHGMAYDRASDRVVIFGFDDTATVSMVWAYDYNTDSWEELPTATALEGYFSYAQAAYVAQSDRVAVFGGQRADGAGGAPTGWVTLDQLWLYDYDANTWQPAAPCPEPRVHHDMVALPSSGHILVFGGGVSDATDEFQSNDLWRYDPARDAWTRLGP